MTYLPIIFASIFLISCVGTIEETRFETTEVVADAINYEDYIGIDEVIATSHHQIEVYFQEVEGIQSDKVSYQIYYDGAEFPIHIPGNSLTPRADGRLMYTVDDLTPNREYYFEVQVTNLLTGESSLSQEKRSAKTFPNRTANFDGVQSVVHQPGPDGMNFIKVSWSPAERESSGLIPLPADVAKYEVTVLSATRQLSDFDNEFLGNEDRKVVYFNDSVNFGVIGGLQAGDTYYARVRAIHHEYYDLLDSDEVRYEENNKYLEITMLTNDATAVLFESDLFSVTKADGVEGLTTARASWGFPTGGAYNHFRIYYKGVDSELISLIDEDLINIRPSQIPCEMNQNAFMCRRFNFTENSADILDLAINYRYSFILVVCLDETCQKSQLSNIQSIVTSADVASYNGFEGYRLGQDFNDLSNLIIEVTPPNLSEGVLDEVIVYYDIENGLGNYVALNPPTSDFESVLDSPLTMLPFNFVLDDEIIFDGVDVSNLVSSFLGEEQQKSYYFKYKRFTQAEGAIDDDYSLNTFVVTPQLRLVTTPIDIRSCQVSPGFTRVTWREPNEGIYTHYEFDLYVNGSLTDSFLLDKSTNEFSDLNYFLGLGALPEDAFKVSIEPVILFEDNLISPTDLGVEVSEIICNQ